MLTNGRPENPVTTARIETAKLNQYINQMIFEIVGPVHILNIFNPVENGPADLAWKKLLVGQSL
jgi:hypothetical protein